MSNPKQQRTGPAPGSPQRSVTSQTRSGQPEPRLPHERDESADADPAPPPEHQVIGEQARRDVESGQVDTDKGPVLEQIANEQFGRSKGGDPRLKR